MKFVLGLLCTLVAASPASAAMCVYAQEREAVLASMLKLHDQKPLLDLVLPTEGAGDLSAMLAVGPDGTWTMFYFRKDPVAVCVLALGTGAVPFVAKKNF